MVNTRVFIVLLATSSVSATCQCKEVCPCYKDKCVKHGYILADGVCAEGVVDCRGSLV